MSNLRVASGYKTGHQTCIPAAFAPITATRIPIGARAPTTFIEIEEPRGFIDLSTALGHRLTYGARDYV